MRLECLSHLGTGGNAVLDRFQHQLHVEPRLFGNRKTFSDSSNLDRAHQVVDELKTVPLPTRAKMPDGAGKRREIGPRPFQIGRISTDQQRQLCRLRPHRAAR